VGVKIVSLGESLGALEVTSELLASRGKLTSNEIIEKTGIASRWYAAENESLLDLSERALQSAGVESGDEFSRVFCATYAHDVIFPSLASRVATRMSIGASQTVDIQSNCTGFLNALLIAHDQMICDPSSNDTLVIAAEMNSVFIDPLDMEAAMFWSDGAGAVRLTNHEGADSLIARAHLFNGENNEAVRLRWGSEPAFESKRFAENIEMGGLATWRQATSGLPRVVGLVLEESSFAISDVDWIIFHQANLRMIEYLTAKLKLDPNKVFTNVDVTGNLGAASIPVALSQLHKLGKLKSGDVILFAAVGAGFQFTSVLWRW
jgi:3-oxoacyl-[acyl-carrier-protein] synthase-3